MKKLTFILMILAGQYASAQHCPYDGSYLVAVKIVNQKGKTITIQKGTVFLVELPTKETDSCSYAAGPVRKPLLNSPDFKADCDQHFSESNSHVLTDRLKNTGIMDKADWMISLNQAEHTCMIKSDSDMRLFARNYVIVYYYNKKEFRVPVQLEDIKSLCTGSKDLINFKPVTIRVHD